jgi:fatty acid desaturase
LIFAGTTAAAFYLFTLRLWVPMIAVCYLHSVFHQMAGMAAAPHELSHGTAFRNKTVNEIFYYLFCFLTWNNPIHFRESHRFHHLYTVHQGLDKEVTQKPVQETMNWINYASWATFDFRWFWTLAKVIALHALGRGDIDYFSWDPLFAKDDPRRGAMIRWARFALLGRLTGAVQHTGLASSAPDWRLVCHTVRFTPVLRYQTPHVRGGSLLQSAPVPQRSGERHAGVSKKPWRAPQAPPMDQEAARSGPFLRLYAGIPRHRGSAKKSITPSPHWHALAATCHEW